MRCSYNYATQKRSARVIPDLKVDHFKKSTFNEVKDEYNSQNGSSKAVVFFHYYSGILADEGCCAF